MRRLVSSAVIVFGIQPSEAWGLTVPQYFEMWELYRMVNGIKPQAEAFTRDDLKRLEREIENGRRRRIKNKDNG